MAPLWRHRDAIRAKKWQVNYRANRRLQVSRFAVRSGGNPMAAAFALEALYSKGSKRPRIRSPGRRPPQRLRHFLRLRHHLPHLSVALIHEVLLDRMIERVEQRVEEPARVHQQNGVQI